MNSTNAMWDFQKIRNAAARTLGTVGHTIQRLGHITGEAVRKYAGPVSAVAGPAINSIIDIAGQGATPWGMAAKKGVSAVTGFLNSGKLNHIADKAQVFGSKVQAAGVRIGGSGGGDT